MVGREGSAGAGDDESAHVGVTLEAVERIADLAEHGGIERIGALGPGERETRDVAEPFEPDGGELRRHMVPGCEPCPRTVANDSDIAERSKAEWACPILKRKDVS